MSFPLHRRATAVSQSSASANLPGRSLFQRSLSELFPTSCCFEVLVRAPSRKNLAKAITGIFN